MSPPNAEKTAPFSDGERSVESGKGAEIVQKVADILRKFAENFLQWPLPERPHKWTAEKNKGSADSSFPDIFDMFWNKSG